MAIYFKSPSYKCIYKLCMPSTKMLILISKISYLFLIELYFGLYKPSKTLSLIYVCIYVHKS